MNRYSIATILATAVCTTLAVTLLNNAARVEADSVTTPCGADVACDHPTPDWNALDKATIDAMITADFPNVAIYTGSATKSYNCHSYAWAGKTEWIDNPGPYIDSYQVDNLNGHQLTYAHCLTNNPTHSAVDHDQLDYKATSKWGALSKVDHDWDDVPDGRARTGGGNYSVYGSVTGIYARRDGCPCDTNDDCGS